MPDELKKALEFYADRANWRHVPRGDLPANVASFTVAVRVDSPAEVRAPNNCALAEAIVDGGDLARAALPPRKPGVGVEEIARVVEFQRMLTALRADEGNSVTLLCDNPEGPPNNAVECCGDWTDWETRRFEGETLFAAVSAAHAALLNPDSQPAGGAPVSGEPT